MTSSASAAAQRFAKRRFLLERDLYAAFLDALDGDGDAALTYLYVVDDTGEELVLAAVSRRVRAGSGDLLHVSVTRSGSSPAAECLRAGQPQHYRGYPAGAPAPVPGIDIALKNHLALPLRDAGAPAGEAAAPLEAVLGFADRAGGFDDEVIARLRSTAEALWPLVAEQRATMRAVPPAEESASSAYDVLHGVISAIASAVELREDHGARHQPNVAWLCDRLAREIGMSEFERRGLAIGASLHDVGKVAVPSAVLAKPAGVSDTEFSLLQTHCEVGAGLFRPLRLPWPVADMIAQHHERLDGSGYPAKLQRDAICEGARIIAIADTYDAMASDRPYRRARGTAAAIDVLRAGRDTLYDGYLVDAFLRCAAPDPGFGGRYTG